LYRKGPAKLLEAFLIDGAHFSALLFNEHCPHGAAFLVCRFPKAAREPVFFKKDK
jgi:hypothetical protein